MGGLLANDVKHGPGKEIEHIPHELIGANRLETPLPEHIIREVSEISSDYHISTAESGCCQDMTIIRIW